MVLPTGMVKLKELGATVRGPVPVVVPTFNVTGIINALPLVGVTVMVPL
jgi:hypothetical protein